MSGPKLGFGIVEAVLDSFSNAGRGAYEAQDVYRQTGSWDFADSVSSALNSTSSFGGGITAAMGAGTDWELDPLTGKYVKK